MTVRTLMRCPVLVTGIALLTTGTIAADAKAPMSDQDAIASAMTAAPAKVAQNASIMTMDAKGAMRMLPRCPTSCGQARPIST